MDFTDFNTVLKLRELLKDRGFDITNVSSDERMSRDYNYYLNEASTSMLDIIYL